MNAKWLNHLVDYRDSEYRIDAIQKIIYQKVLRQASLLRRHKKSFFTVKPIKEVDIKKIFLIEARYARIYWKTFSTLLPNWCVWNGRVPQGEDVINKFLDIGYHTLALIIQKKCEALDIPYEIGIYHNAQSPKAHPLVYDLMECFRVSMVDEVLLKFLRMKKLPIDLAEHHIQEFLHDVYSTLRREYYHKGRHACISFSYWIDLILLEFRNSVSEKRPFDPRWTPVRHETKCNKNPPKQFRG